VCSCFTAFWLCSHRVLASLHNIPMNSAAYLKKCAPRHKYTDFVWLCTKSCDHIIVFFWRDWVIEKSQCRRFVPDHLITLFRVHVNTTFRFINRNELTLIETKVVHVNIATVKAQLPSLIGWCRLFKNVKYHLISTDH